MVCGDYLNHAQLVEMSAMTGSNGWYFASTKRYDSLMRDQTPLHHRIYSLPTSVVYHAMGDGAVIFTVHREDGMLDRRDRGSSYMTSSCYATR